MTDNFLSAQAKIGADNMPDLPQTRDDKCWDDYKNTYKLTLPELSALKNHACPVHRDNNETPKKRSWVEEQHGWTDAGRKATQSFVEEVGKTGFDIFVNGKPIGGGAFVVQGEIRECPVSLEDAVVDDLGLAPEHMTATVNLPTLELDVKVGLLKYGETEFQTSAEFQDGLIHIQAAHALDNSDDSVMGPFYNPLPNLPSVDQKTAKANATSTVAPMDFMMMGQKDESAEHSAVGKHDWQVLKQAVQQSSVRLQLAGYLSWTVTFAVTNRSAWCLIGKRHLSSAFQTHRAEHCHRFWRIPHDSITRLWMGVTRKATQSPLFFLTRDGSMLWNALDKIGVPPWSCGVQMLGMSQSNVYGVSLPAHGDSLKIDTRTIDYALKVVLEDEENYTREVQALKTIANRDSTFYAVGHVRGGEEPNLFNASHHWRTGPTVSPAEESKHAWWWRKIPKENLTATGGGVIFMKYGSHTATGRNDDVETVCRGVCYSLQVSHRAGILHCDIRNKNVLFFEGVGWRLINFGLSCKAEDGKAYDLEKDSGAQAKAAGPRVIECLANSEPVHWTVGDDYEMAMKMFGLLPPG